jgi:hypothetical protein
MQRIYTTKLINVSGENRELLEAEKEYLENKESSDFKEFHQKGRNYSSEFLGKLEAYERNEINIVERLLNGLSTHKKGTKGSLGLYEIRNKFMNYLDFKNNFPNFARQEMDEKRKFVERSYRGEFSLL